MASRLFDETLFDGESEGVDELARRLIGRFHGALSFAMAEAARFFSLPLRGSPSGPFGVPTLV